MKILVLEDDSYRVTTFIEKFCTHDLYITENAFRAIDYLENNVFDYIFLDHDLGENNGCGIDVATYLLENPNNKNNDASIIIHSWNTPASLEMKSRLPLAVHMLFGSADFFSLVLDK